MTSFTEERIVPWAAARSIFGAGEVMNSFHSKSPRLEPELLSNTRIAIGKKGLVFKDASLLRAIETGFSMPELFPLFKNPVSGFKAIVTLKKISRIYESRSVKETHLIVILRAGLEALAVFANHHPMARDLFSEFPEELIVFRLKDSSPLGWLRRSSQEGFSAGTGNLEQKPSVLLSFSSVAVAFDAVKRGLDPLGAPATGEVEILGKVHLMDKIGYVSRMTLREVPMPR